jgi:hypothetical protein
VGAIVWRSVRGKFGGSTTEPGPQDSENRLPMTCPIPGSRGCSRFRIPVPRILLHNYRL